MKNILILFGLSLLLIACSTQSIEPEIPENPFDLIENPTDTLDQEVVDTSSIVGIHRFIFSLSCAVPGCHDGSFEPDFRTVQSAYSSLVYQPVIKNTQDQAYKYRVLPGSLEESWFYYRITTEDQELGRMPLYDNPLDEWKIEAVKDWIMEGARDQFGNKAKLPNQQPKFKALAAFQRTGGYEIRVDTFRDNDAAPFGSKYGLPVTIWFELEDDSTQAADFQDVEVKMDVDPQNLFDFSPDHSFTAQYNPRSIPDFYGPGEDETFHWSISFNNTLVPAQKYAFLRIYLNDGDQEENLEYPHNNSSQEDILYMTMFVVP